MNIPDDVLGRVVLGFQYRPIPLHAAKEEWISGGRWNEAS